MKNRAYFQYWESFEVIVNRIKDIEEREHFRKIIINYGLYGEEPAGLSELEDMAWAIVKDMIDQQKHRRQVNANNAKKTPPAEEPANTIRVNNGGEDIARQAEKSARFQKPTKDEVAAYIKEKGYNVNSDSFFNYYEANGWKIGGRASMKNWKAAVTNWNAREKTSTAGGTIYQQPENVADEYDGLF